MKEFTDADIKKINKGLEDIDPRNQGLRLTDGEVAISKLNNLEKRIDKIEKVLKKAGYIDE